MRSLLAHGADPNVRRAGNESPLMHAAFNDDETAVRLLLDAGADPNLRGREGNTAVFYSGTLPVLNLLMAAGADINIQGTGGSTALMQAIVGGAFDAALVLIEAGADVKVRNARGQTALDVAQEQRRKTREPALTVIVRELQRRR